MTRHGASRSAYRALLRLYPRWFREKFGAQMLADFDEMQRSDGALATWKRVLLDASVSIPAEHSSRVTKNAAHPALATLSRTEWAGPARGLGLGLDLRYVLRSLRKAPLYTLVAATTMALGIGATTAIFSLVRATLLKPLPFDSPERIVALWQWNHDAGTTNTISPATFRDFELRATTFAEMAAHDHGSFTLTEEELAPQVIQAGYVQASFFDVLGVEPLLGRDFDPEEDVRGSHYVVVLTEDLWRDRFGANPDILGTMVTLDREPHRVIGVMPRGLDFPPDVVLWRPLALPEERWTTQRGSHFLRGIARLKDGVSVEAAREELKAIAANLAVEYPTNNEGWGAEVIPIEDELVADVRASIFLLQVSVLLVLAIACVNVAGLQIGRADRRRVELAIRAALGAGFIRVTRLLVLESLVVALAGSALGLLVAWTLVALLRPLSPIRLPEVSAMLTDGAVLAFALVVSLGLGLLFGLAPALRSSTHVGLGKTRPRHRLRESLVTVEVALSLVLLVGAGWFLQSFARLSRVDAGVRTENVLTARVSIPHAVYAEPGDRMRFFESLNEKMEQIPGVRSAALSSLLPISGSPGWWRNSFHRPEHPPETPADQVTAYLRWVSPSYMETIGIPLLRGRGLEPTDTIDQPKVLLVDESFADEFFRGEDPIGKRIVVEYNDWEAEIVGIVGNTRQASLRDRFEPHMYLPYRQTYEAMYLGSMAVVLRADGDPSLLSGPLREAVRSLDPNLAVVAIETLSSRLASSLESDRFRLTLIAGFAILALVLALVGLYGVIAFIVGERRREVGVRMALGARAKDVLVLVLGQGARLIGAGVALGLLATVALSKLVAPFLFEVRTESAVTLAAVSALLAAVALVAVWIPARAAARVDPITVLRYE